MKQFFFILFIGLFSLNSFGQDLPPNPKPGNCYVRCTLEDGSLSNWQTIDCKLAKMSKDSVKFKALQIKLINFGYDVNMSGKVDLKTIEAYKKYTKYEKRSLRKSKRNR